MSNFILNLVRRGVGLAAMTALQPSDTLSFMPNIGTSHQTEPEAEMASYQQSAPPVSFSTPQVLTRVMPTQEPSALREEATPPQHKQPVTSDPSPKSLPPEEQQFPSQNIQPMTTPISPHVSPARTEPQILVPNDAPEPVPPVDMPPRPLIQEGFAEPVSQPQTVQATVVRLDSGPEISAQVQPVLPDTTAKRPPLIRPAAIQPPTFPISAKPAVRSSEPPPIHVRIGTIEVRATTPRAALPPPVPKARGFDAYAHIRNYVNWGQ